MEIHRCPGSRSEMICLIWWIFYSSARFMEGISCLSIYELPEIGRWIVYDPMGIDFEPDGKSKSYEMLS